MTREEAIRRMRAEHSSASQHRQRLVWVDSKLQRRAERKHGGGFPVTGPWSYRETCEHDHGWRDVGEHWMQCKRCWWCKPKLGKPPVLEKLPAILKNRVLPPLAGKVDMRSVYRNAGFVLDDDASSVLSILRVRVVQHVFVEEPLIRRCSVEVKFKEHGWHYAAVFNETALYRVLEVAVKASPRKPRALWLALQQVYSKGWPKPWEIGQ